MPATRRAALTAARNVALPTNGLWAHYDASVAASVHDSAGRVDQWDDISGNGRHLTATTTQRPFTGSRTMNGRNVLDFQGAQVMSRTSGISFPISAFTIIAVWGTDGVPSQDYSGFMSIYTGSNDYDNANSFDLNAGNTAHTFYFECNNTAVNNSGSGATPIGTYAVRKSTVSGLSDFVTPAGALTNGTLSAAGTATTGIQIGARVAGGISTTYSIDGPIAEIRIYVDRKSDADRNLLRAAMIAKWGA